MDPVFVVGCSRSGTTWMSRMVSEAIGASWLGEAMWGASLAAGQDPGAGVRSRRVVDKTPWNVFYVADLIRRYPRGRVIEMVRDPRAVVASMLAATAWARHSPGFDVCRAAELWRRAISAGREAKVVAGRSMLTVRYEELRSQPRDVLWTVLARLGYDVPPRTIANAVDKYSFARYQRMGKTGTKRFVRLGEPDAWRSELSSTEIAVLRQSVGEVAAVHGYDLG